MNAKKVSESMTVMTELIMPNDTNPIGNLMGGNLMRWMDIAGGICAAKHCGAHVVTASVDHVSFKKPIGLGDVISIKACVTRAFNTSVEIFLEVHKSNLTGVDQEKSNVAYMTFVAMDAETHRPIQVPKVIPESAREKELFEGAVHRRELRLMLSGRIQVEDAKAIRALFAERERANS